MNKNWLIRTKSNHILGPISKTKTCELYKNGSIKPDDEICSGNGYWFFVKETDLIQKYLLGDVVQTFNPISEANDSLDAHKASPIPKKEVNSDQIKMPTEDDLAFPDMGMDEAIITPPTIVPDIPIIPKAKPVLNNVHIEPPKRREVSRPQKENAIPELVRPKISDHRKLYTLAIIVLALAISALLYRKYANKSSTVISQHLSLFNVAYADNIEIKKKK